MGPIRAVTAYAEKYAYQLDRVYHESSLEDSIMNTMRRALLAETRKHLNPIEEETPNGLVWNPAWTNGFRQTRPLNAESAAGYAAMEAQNGMATGSNFTKTPTRFPASTRVTASLFIKDTKILAEYRHVKTSLERKMDSCQVFIANKERIGGFPPADRSRSTTYVAQLKGGA